MKGASAALLMVLAVSACGGSTGDAASGESVAADTLALPSVGGATAADTAGYVYATTYGVGDIRAGMTLDEARVRTPDLRIIAGSDSLECSYLAWPSAPAGVLVMFDGGRVARVDIDSTGVRTEAGVQVGDSASRIDSAYADFVVTRSPHKYTDGEYYAVTPMRAADSLYRIIFEVEHGRVSRYRVGIRPQVEYVEGCS